MTSFTQPALETRQWESLAWKCDAAFGRCCDDARSLPSLARKVVARWEMLGSWAERVVAQELPGEMGRQTRHQSPRRRGRRR